LSTSSTLRLAFAAALLCLLLAACGGGTTTVTVLETSPTQEGEAETSSDQGAETSSGETSSGETSSGETSGGLESFQTPSGNIGCYIGPEGARCDIAERDWTAPRPQDCPSEVDSGQGLEVTASGPGQVVCAGDTALNPDARALPYGDEIQAGDFTCHSREDGVECLDDGDGRGFFISKQSYRLF